MIDTGKVSDRRKLRFDSIALLRGELDTLEAAERAGKVRRAGNWSVAQNLTHLAAFINYAYDGYPEGLRNPPWMIKFILKLMKNKLLNGGLPSGRKIPGIPGGTTGVDEVPTAEAFATYRAALARLEKAAPTAPNVIFGALTHEEWTKMHLRHAELHLSFLHPG